MIRKIFAFCLVLATSLFGMDYASFEKEVLSHSKILEVQRLALKMTEHENNILLRASNPQLGLEVAGYDQDLGDTTLGYAVNFTQRVRTGAFMHGLKMKTKASELLKEAYVTQGRSGYMKTLQTLYTEYVYASRMIQLLQREQQLLDQVANMVKSRYQSGSDTKVSYLQAKSEASRLQTQIFTQRAKRDMLYHQLLSIAGLQKKVALQKRFIYPIAIPTSKNNTLTPKQQLLFAKEKLYESQYAMHKNSFQSYDIVGGVEDEPDQMIGHVGVAMPLAIFNTQKEERSLAKLKLHQIKLQKEHLTIETKAQKQIHRDMIKELVNQYHALRHLQDEEQELVDLLQEGYKIAKSSLFVLMRAKNKLIETKRTLLRTQKEINLQIIQLRYLQGTYND